MEGYKLAGKVAMKVRVVEKSQKHYKLDGNHTEKAGGQITSRKKQIVVYDRGAKPSNPCG